jgi:hypothetical protein
MNHLSRNSTLHKYKEMEEEVLITILKKLKAIYDTSTIDKHDQLILEHLCEVHTTHEKNAHLHKVLHHEGLCVMLATQLMPLGPHFQHGYEFVVNWLTKSINNCLGVIIFNY